MTREPSPLLLVLLGILVGGLLVGVGVVVGTQLTGDRNVDTVAEPSPAAPAPTEPTQTPEPEPQPQPEPEPERAPAEPEYSSITYPLDCGGAGVELLDSFERDYTDDGRNEAVRLVRCQAGAGTPPSGLYVFSADDDGAPELLATLLDPAHDLLMTEFYTEGDEVYGPASAYSSNEVARCCPDLEVDVNAFWDGSDFEVEVVDRSY